MYKKLIYLFFVPLFFIQCQKDSATTSQGGFGTTGAGGSLTRFAITGNYLYSVDENKLKAFDISTPNDPILKNSQDVGFAIETIFPVEDKLFIGSSSKLYIYSIADPANPKKLSDATSPNVFRRCDPVVAKDSVAYATLRTNGACGGTQSVLAVFNIKDILNPVQVSTIPVFEPYGLGYKNDVLYVCDRQTGLILFDISQPYQPVRLNNAINDGIYLDVIPYQNTLICWVSTGIILYDITDNRNPVLIATIN
ncbi:MAG: hypothetical protein M3Z56_00920 [Bacteroidota bacterium]|nr:hypothetical protein [Bacteroidota bacterium]